VACHHRAQRHPATRLAATLATGKADWLATATVRERRPGKIGQPEHGIQFTICKQPGVRGDPTAVELQPQTAVEIHPDGAVIRFIRALATLIVQLPRITICSSR
jgi:hypothetical protein